LLQGDTIEKNSPSTFNKECLRAAIGAFMEREGHDAPVRKYLDGVLNLGFDNFGEEGHFDASSLKWLCGELSNGTTLIPQLRLPNDTAKNIRGIANGVAAALFEVPIVRQKLTELATTKAVNFGIQPDPQARAIAEMLLGTVKYFREVTLSSIHGSVVTARAPERLGQAMSGLTVVALEVLQQSFSNELLLAIGSSELLTGSSEACMERVAAVLKRAPAPPSEEWARVRWKDFAHDFREVVQRIDPFRQQLVVAMTDYRGRVALGNLMRDNPVLPCDSLPDFARPQGSVVFHCNLPGTKDLTVISATHSQTGQATLVVMDAAKAADHLKVLNGGMEGNKEIDPHAAGFVVMRMIEGEFTVFGPGEYAPLADSDEQGISGLSPKEYLTRLRNHVDRLMVEVWSKLPTLFSQTEHISNLQIAYLENGVLVGCTEEQKGIVAELLAHDLKVTPDALQGRKEGASGELGAEYAFLFERSLFESKEVASEYVPSKVELVTSEALRNRLSSTLYGVPSFAELYRILSKNFDVELHANRGKGGHIMLFRGEYGCPVSGDVRSEKEPLRQKVGLNILKALNIEPAEFLECMERERRGWE
jgi:hypothetical protein